MALLFTPWQLCLNVYHVTFVDSTLDGHISKSKNDRNKQIPDILLRKDYISTIDKHAQRDAQKHSFIYDVFMYWAVNIIGMGP